MSLKHTARTTGIGSCGWRPLSTWSRAGAGRCTRGRSHPGWTMRPTTRRSLDRRFVYVSCRCCAVQWCRCVAALPLQTKKPPTVTILIISSFFVYIPWLCVCSHVQCSCVQALFCLHRPGDINPAADRATHVPARLTFSCSGKRHHPAMNASSLPSTGSCCPLSAGYAGQLAARSWRMPRACYHSSLAPTSGGERRRRRRRGRRRKCGAVHS